MVDGGLRPVTEEETIAIRNKAARAIQAVFRELGLPTISDEEVEFLWGITDEKEAAKKLLDEFGIRLAMITMGPKGAYLANQNGAAYAKCPKVKPIDTTGAGDIFGGSAVSRLLKTGKAPEELNTEELGFIGQFACTAASISTTQSGGIPSIPEEAAVLDRM